MSIRDGNYSEKDIERILAGKVDTRTGERIRKSVGKPSEFSEQCAVIQWARVNERKYPCLRWLHCSLNGVKLTLGQARKAKAAGMVAGIADLCLPYPSGRYYGLWLELKTKRGRLEPEQKEWLEYLRSVGYAAFLVQENKEKSIFELATAIIEEYVRDGKG